MMRKPNPTQDFYRHKAQSFIAGTLVVDMAPLYTRFMAYLPPGARLLDAGCGSGRDSLFLRQQGYHLLAIDACEAFVTHTRAYAGVEALCLRFDELTYHQAFDGIWASASLLHVPPAELPATVDKLGKALKPGGVLYASFKYGNFAGLRHDRWFTDLDEQSLESLLSHIPQLHLLDSWQSHDARPERAHELWLNILLQAR